MRLWLDDVRPKPDGYSKHVKTAKEAVCALKTGEYTGISFDHDLGDEIIYGCGYEVAKWIEEMAFLGKIARLEWLVHSANPVGRARISSAMYKAEEYWNNHEENR